MTEYNMSIYDNVKVKREMDQIKILTTVAGVVAATSVWCMTSL